MQSPRGYPPVRVQWMIITGISLFTSSPFVQVIGVIDELVTLLWYS